MSLYTPETYATLLKDANILGFAESHRHQPTHSLPAIIFKTTGHNVYRPGFNSTLAQLEGFQLIAGYTDREALELAAPKTFADGYFDGTNVEYGEMYAKLVIERLEEGIHKSRQCVIFGATNDDQSTDMPCAPAIHLQLIQGVFVVTVFQRSWDLIRGLPYNVVMWLMAGTAWRHLIGAKELEVRFLASNPHVYVNDIYRHMDEGAAVSLMDLAPLVALGDDPWDMSMMAREVIDRWKESKLKGTTWLKGDITPIHTLMEICRPQ